MKLRKIEEDVYLWSTLHRLLNGVSLIIEELPQLLHVNERFTIQNMRITKKEEHDVF